MGRDFVAWMLLFGSRRNLLQLPIDVTQLPLQQVELLLLAVHGQVERLEQVLCEMQARLQLSQAMVQSATPVASLPIATPSDISGGANGPACHPPRTKPAPPTAASGRIRRAYAPRSHLRAGGFPAPASSTRSSCTVTAGR